jgi:hypothetical protein
MAARTTNCRELVLSLNVLAGVTNANGGVTTSAATAANIWAGTTGLELLDALNRKAGNTLPNYRDMNAVCNQLAGTTNLEAQDAMDQYATAGGVYVAKTWSTITGTWAANTKTWSTV